MAHSFDTYPLNAALQKVLAEQGFVEPTEIQAQVIPLLLEKTSLDMHGQAQTGTGKTLAFGLPLLHRIDVAKRAVQGLVIAPTRELAVQIHESLQPFARAMGIVSLPVYGGVSMERQISALRKGVHLVIGTPGRINDHLNRGTLQLGEAKTLVLDEADIMLDMGFREEVDEILGYMPQNREIWLFSATVKQGVQAIMREHMHNTVTISVSKEHVGSVNTKQYYCVVPNSGRVQALCRFIEAAPEFYGFVFCQTKILTAEVADQLIKRGYRIGALHGDMSQAQRNAVLSKFRSRELSIVVATDVAGRGIDVQDLTHVVNFSLPEDYESYVHRTGRTGRAGKEGVAITFITRHQLRDIQFIERKFKIQIQQAPVPTRDVVVQKRLERAASYLDTIAGHDGIDEKVHSDLTTLVNKFDQSQLGAMVARVVYDKFLKHLMQESDAIEDQSRSSSYAGDRDRVIDPNAGEVMIAIGTDEGITREDLISMIEREGFAADQLRKVRMIKRRTFIEVPKESVEHLVGILRPLSVQGRQFRPQRVEAGNGGGNNGRRSSSRPFRSSGRWAGGFAGRSRPERRSYGR